MNEPSTSRVAQKRARSVSKSEAEKQEEKKKKGRRETGVSRTRLA